MMNVEHVKIQDSVNFFEVSVRGLSAEFRYGEGDIVDIAEASSSRPLGMMSKRAGNELGTVAA